MRILSLNKFYQRIIYKTAIILLIIAALNLFSVFLNRAQYNTTKFQESTKSNWVLVYFNAQLGDYYQEKKSSATLTKAYDDLASPQYFEISEQPIEIAGYLGPKRALYTYDLDGGLQSLYSEYKEGVEYDLAFIDALQISVNVQERFRLNVQSGSLLRDAVFEYRANDPIHVLLGSDYRDCYSIGDQLTGWYLFQKFAFTVDGFLAPDSCIDVGRNHIALNAMLVMPSIHIAELPNSIDDHVFFVRHYANKLSGKYEYATVHDAEAFIKKCEALSQNADFSYETHDIAESIEDSLLFALFGSRFYYDGYTSLLILATILCAAFQFLLSGRRTQEFNASEGAPRRFTGHRFAEFSTAIGLASAIFYFVCRILSLRYSIFVLASSILALIAASVRYALNRRRLKRRQAA